MTYEARCVRQYKSRIKTLKDGSLLIPLEMGLWDIFYGKGWTQTSRFRLYRLKRDKSLQLICLGGLQMSHELRETLLKECSHG
jgi:hypothetical protein